MATDIQVKMEQGIVRVVYRGKPQFHLTTEMMREVGRVASENRSTMLLFDVREAEDSEYHVSAIKHTELAPALGINQSYRTALLGRKGDPRLPYIEDVAVNRGFRLKVFTDEAEAVAWLRAAL